MKIRTYQQWLKDFVDGVLEYYETEGDCDFTPELQYFFEQIGFDKEKAQLITQSIASWVAWDIKEAFEERGQEVFVKPYTYPYPEVRLVSSK